MSRRNARENAFKIIFASTDSAEEKLLEDFFNGEKDSELWTGKAPEEDDRAYIERACIGVREQREDIDKTIEKYLENWTIDRINRVCLAAMRLAVYEMKNLKGIPFKVSASEAVEIVKKYAGSKEAKFVNGVLGKFIKNELDEQEK